MGDAVLGVIFIVAALAVLLLMFLPNSFGTSPGTMMFAEFTHSNTSGGF